LRVRLSSERSAVGSVPWGLPRRVASNLVRPVLLYTAARLGLFAVALGLLWLLQLRGLWLVAGAVLLSGLASYVVLARQRDAVSGVVAGRLERGRRRIDDGARSEDDD
jgi:hypothetical protein